MSFLFNPCEVLLSCTLILVSFGMASAQTTVLFPAMRYSLATIVSLMVYLQPVRRRSAVGQEKPQAGGDWRFPVLAWVHGRFASIILGSRRSTVLEFFLL